MTTSCWDALKQERQNAFALPTGGSETLIYVSHTAGSGTFANEARGDPMTHATGSSTAREVVHRAVDRKR